MDNQSLARSGRETNTEHHPNNRAIAYVRVSGDRQRDHGYSLDGQRRELRQWTDENGYRKVEEIEDGA